MTVCFVAMVKKYINITVRRIAILLYFRCLIYSIQNIKVFSFFILNTFGRKMNKPAMQRSPSSPPRFSLNNAIPIMPSNLYVTLSPFKNMVMESLTDQYIFATYSWAVLIHFWRRRQLMQYYSLK